MDVSQLGEYLPNDIDDIIRKFSNNEIENCGIYKGIYYTAVNKGAYFELICARPGKIEKDIYLFATKSE